MSAEETLKLPVQKFTVRQIMNLPKFLLFQDFEKMWVFTWHVFSYLGVTDTVTYVTDERKDAQKHLVFFQP